jgi:hypothetical protein
MRETSFDVTVSESGVAEGWESDGETGCGSDDEKGWRSGGGTGCGSDDEEGWRSGRESGCGSGGDLKRDRETA